MYFYFLKLYLISLMQSQMQYIKKQLSADFNWFNKAN